jgi:hypothetical protein
VATRELHLFTYAQVVEHLADAARAVAEVELTDELRPIAFAQACAWLSQKQVMADVAGPIQLAAPMAVPRGPRH